MKRIIISISLILAAVIQLRAQNDPLQPFRGKIGKTLEESEQWWPERVKAADGAPNVLWIMLDDVGFGASSAFGGLIETPTFDKLADDGIRYTNFHTAGICSPTRAALLTGRNAHSVGMGHHAELGTGFPGYIGDVPFEAGMISEVFRENGYNTYALGKWHGNRSIDQNAAGPFNRHATGRGFDRFYGFLGGATDQWYPDLLEGITPVDLEGNKKHLNELLADKAIEYVANQKSVDPEKPFFLYLATGATHFPHQVSREWINKYKGKFDEGWDVYREKVFARQQELGILPANTKLPPRQEPLRAWEALSADEKKVAARFFEVYAAFLSYTDYEIGRIVDYLKEIDQFDNTLVFVIIGDNGSSKEGSYTGTTGMPGNASGQDLAFLLDQYDKIGTEYSYPNIPLAWSQATNTPFRYWKSDANSEGATHNPLIVHYPKGIKNSGGIRTQYGHVIDIFPTSVELAGIKIPEVINGYDQLPIHGISLAYSLEDPRAPSRRTVQYYEIHGGRAIYNDGWKAAVYHPRSFFGDENETDIHFKVRSFDEDEWELYNLNDDWNETNNLASTHPDKLEALKALFDSEAEKNNVYPLKNYRTGVPVPEIKEKVVIYRGTTARTRVYPGEGEITLTANVALKEDKDQGVIFSNGGLNRGGSSLFVKDNKLYYVITDGVDEEVLVSKRLLFSGEYEIGVKIGSDGAIKVFVDGEPVAERNNGIPRNKFLNSLGGDGISLSRDVGVPVTKIYTGTYPFTGVVKQLVVEQKTD